VGYRTLDRRQRADGGFTLLELLVTLAVVALALGLTVPMLNRSTEAIRARAEIASFSAVLRHARERAITSGTPHAVVIEPTARRIVVRAGGPDGEIRHTRTLPERLTVQASSPAVLAVRFEPQGGSSGADFQVAAGGVAYRVTVDPLTGRVRSVRR
jgi:general secretion pathway protein H